MPVFCFEDRLLDGRHASGPAHPVPARVPGRARRRAGRARRRARGPARPRRARACRAWPREVGRRGGALQRRRGAVRAAPDRGRVARLRAQASRRSRTRAWRRWTTSARCAPRPASPTRCSRPSTAAGSRQPRRDVIGAPRRLPALPSGLAKGRLPVARLARSRAGGRGAAAAAARRRRASGSSRFLDGDVPRYADNHDALGARPHLAALALPPLRLPVGARDRGAPAARSRGGGVPAPALLARLPPPRAPPLPAQRPLGVPGALPRQHLAGATPASASRPGARAARGSRSWTPGCASCGARAGCTTARGSWSGSFLTKDLGIDWRWGERWFMRLLVDGDEANNNGNWQWIASVGTDPQPAFRRIYNPARQMERHDPERPLRAPLRARAARRARRASGRAVEDARGDRSARPAAWWGRTTRSRSWTTPRRAARRWSATGSRNRPAFSRSSFAGPCRYRPHVHRDARTVTRIARRSP